MLQGEDAQRACQKVRFSSADGAAEHEATLLRPQKGEFASGRLGASLFVARGAVPFDVGVGQGRRNVRLVEATHASGELRTRAGGGHVVGAPPIGHLAQSESSAIADCALGDGVFERGKRMVAAALDDKSLGLTCRCRQRSPKRWQVQVSSQKCGTVKTERFFSPLGRQRFDLLHELPGFAQEPLSF